MKTIAILQPGFIPWLGFFDQMTQSDVFVIYDDVQFDKDGWRNRNKIRTSHGWQWLTIPILTKGKGIQAIREVCINNGDAWQSKHIKTIEQNYHKTAFFPKYFPKIQEIYRQKWDLLLALNMKFIYALTEFLGLRTPIVFSSDLNVHGEKTEKLVKICKIFDAKVYLSGDKAKEYLDEMAFEREGISVKWHAYQHPTYRQAYSPFVPYLSIVDLLFNYGSESLNILTRKKEASSCTPSWLPAAQAS